MEHLTFNDGKTKTNYLTLNYLSKDISHPGLLLTD